jgi:signal transduction histidine kinase
LGTLAAGIAHEINTPIQFIRDNLTFLTEECKNLIYVLKNNIQWIQKEDDLEKVRLKISQDEIVQDLAYLETEIPKALEEAGEGAQRVSKIVQSIRIFSHLNENKGSKVSVDLNKSLEPALFLSKSEWKQIAKVELIPQESLPLVKCYITEINQVVMNLIINAIHSIEEKQSKTQKDNFIGQVKIFTYKEEDSIVIRIEDNGKGIPKAIQEKVYDPFFTTKEVGKGTGQGLSLCYKTIVEGHNGELYFETKENQGTTFFIKLPT